MTDVLVGNTIGQSSVSNTDSQPFSNHTTSSIPIDVVCDVNTGQSDVLIPTELITSTDTNTNLPMDVVSSCVNVTESAAGVSATTTNIIVNVPSSIPTADITVPSPALSMIY